MEFRNVVLRVDYPNKTTTNPSRFSDRDRMKTAKSDEDKLEKALKTRRGKGFLSPATGEDELESYVSKLR